MNILLVCKYIPEFKSGVAPFNETLLSSLINQGHKVDIYPIKRNGFLGYLYHIFNLNLILLKKNNIDIVHGISGFSGLVAFFQPFKKSLITFIGSEIYNIYERRLLKLLVISDKRISIFVSKKIFNLAGKPANSEIIPFGIDLSKFHPMEKDDCKKQLGMDYNKTYILFGARFDRKVKNSKLIHDALAIMNDNNIELLELKEINDNILNTLYNAIDILVLTSFHEGSPTVIKEAMACNCPIVATDVGDIKEIINGIEGCYITTYNPNELAIKLNQAIKFVRENNRTCGRRRIADLGLNSDTIVRKIVKIYKSILE